MNHPSQLLTEMRDVIRERYGHTIQQFRIPPPVFVTLQGEFIEFDAHASVLIARFPVLEQYINPYGTLQGGMVSALIDNTLGPLSFLVAPPNVTRRLEITYNQPVTLDHKYVIVTGRLAERNEPWLEFRAHLRGPSGRLLARARASHWILSANE
jgi:acyl-coenzyme A thioesterase PaaI-like protein